MRYGQFVGRYDSRQKKLIASTWCKDFEPFFYLKEKKSFSKRDADHFSKILDKSQSNLMKLKHAQESLKAIKCGRVVIK